MALPPPLPTPSCSSAPPAPGRGLAARRVARVALLALVAAGLVLAVAPEALAGKKNRTTSDWMRIIEKRAKRERKIRDYDEQTKDAIRAEFKRLGKNKGDWKRAIQNVLNQQQGVSAVGPDAFRDTVYELLRDNCVRCHGGSGPGVPHIAHGNLITAYDAVVGTGKVRLGDPPRSRLVERLSKDQHYCWGDCDENAARMTLAISDWARIEEAAGGVGVQGMIQSVSQRLEDGTKDADRGRVDRHVIALWEFKEGEGEYAFDTSGVKPAANLKLENVDWVTGYGLLFDDGGARAMATKKGSKKLYKRIAHPKKGSQQYTIETWMEPANTDQDGPARVISYADPREGTGKRNFMLGQNLYTAVFRNRTFDRKTDVNGGPDLVTSDEDEDIQAALQHVVITYDQYRGRRVYVNGRFTGDQDPAGAGPLWNWKKKYLLSLGNETTRNRPWQGKIRMVAIYDAALTKDEIQANFLAGVGERFQVRFPLDQWFLQPGHFVELDVREFDEYSYLLCEPAFLGPDPLSVPVRNLRVAVNGNIAPSGQAFVHVDMTVLRSGTQLSRLCSIIPRDQGSELDRFSIVFERLGNYENVVAEEVSPRPPFEELPGPVPAIGVRSFDRINATMSAVSGVPATRTSVRTTFEDLRQALPGTADARSFVSANQVGISRLALAYCDEMVEDPALRDAFFDTSPPVEFDQPATVAFSDAAKKDLVADKLMDKMIGTGLANQPSRSEVRDVVGRLIDTLLTGCDATTCGPDRTLTVTKAVCSAVLSSAPMLVE